MKILLRYSLFVFQILFILISEVLISQNRNEDLTNYPDDFLKPEIYKERRNKILQAMEQNSVAVFKASDKKRRNSDTEFPFRQDGNFQYITDCIEPFSILLLVRDGYDLDGVSIKEILFIREYPIWYQKYIGKGISTKEMKDLLKFDAVLLDSKFQEYFNKIMNGKKILYFPRIFENLLNEIIVGKKVPADQEYKKIFQEKFPNIEIKYVLDNQIYQMRQVKCKEEIDYLKKAINSTCIGYIEASKSCEPGMYEYELQAVIEYAFKKEGCESWGFPSIIGSGPNSIIWHYEANRRKIKEGDVIVMDIGGEYHGYSADITRTIPVSGKFTEPQKEIYELVLKANQEVIKAIKPGMKLSELDKISANIIGNGLVKLGITKDKKGMEKFSPLGLIGHDIGLDVHDVGQAGAPLKQGQIITIEPGIYIYPNSEGVDSKYWNIGIRIEDDVLVTDKGYEVLSLSAPKTIKEIEGLMQKKGIGNQKIGLTK